MMFESALALEVPGRRSPLLLSFTIQTLAVGVVLLIPLYYVEQLTVLPTMPVPVYAPKLPHVKIMSVVREAASAFAPQLVQPSARRPLTAPTRIPVLSQQRAVISDAGAPQFADVPAGGFAGDGFLVGDRGLMMPPPAPPEPKAEAKAPRTGPVRVGGDVQSARLIHQVRPLYPALAKQVRTQGTVRLQAIIGRDGAIQNLQLMSGHPLLVPAAVDAVKQWRYRPTLLNGETVEVLTQIDVHFHLH